MSILSVNIAASNVEGALFGIFMALAVASICLLVHRRWKEVNVYAIGPVDILMATRGIWRSTLFVATIFFVLLITVHWALGVRRMFDAVIYYEHGTAAGSYYANLRHPLEVSRTALLIATMLTGDLILIHRMWIVWNRQLTIAIAPIVTSMGLLSSGIGVLHAFSMNEPSEGIFTKKVTEWIIGVVVSTLLTKLYGTAMISYRIYVVTSCLKNNGLQRSGRGLLEILMIFVESSMLSTAWTIFFAIAYATKSPLQAFPTSCSPAVNGIAFVLITVRVGLGWDLQLGITGPQDDPQAATLAPFQTYPMRTIRLTVTTTVERETDFALQTEQTQKSSNSALPMHKE